MHHETLPSHRSSEQSGANVPPGVDHQSRRSGSLNLEHNNDNILDDYEEEEEEEPFLSETEEQLAAAEVPETQAAH